ncbi:hypothetical protein BU17DRAFT_98989 [Hysterangium stoloniferum]|nr:hypothetical protein BU17DRAFT_98989 [Hysterangium stoloniferum]
MLSPVSEQEETLQRTENWSHSFVHDEIDSGRMDFFVGDGSTSELESVLTNQAEPSSRVDIERRTFREGNRTSRAYSPYPDFHRQSPQGQGMNQGHAPYSRHGWRPQSSYNDAMMRSDATQHHEHSPLSSGSPYPTGSPLSLASPHQDSSPFSHSSSLLPSPYLGSNLLPQSSSDSNPDLMNAPPYVGNFSAALEGSPSTTAQHIDWEAGNIGISSDAFAISDGTMTERKSPISYQTLIDGFGDPHQHGPRFAGDAGGSSHSSVDLTSYNAAGGLVLPNQLNDQVLPSQLHDHLNSAFTHIPIPPFLYTSSEPGIQPVDAEPERSHSEERDTELHSRSALHSRCFSLPSNLSHSPVDRFPPPGASTSSSSHSPCCVDPNSSDRTAGHPHTPNRIVFEDEETEPSHSAVLPPHGHTIKKPLNWVRWAPLRKVNKGKGPDVIEFNKRNVKTNEVTPGIKLLQGLCWTDHNYTIDGAERLPLPNDHSKGFTLRMPKARLLHVLGDLLLTSRIHSEIFHSVAKLIDTACESQEKSNIKMEELVLVRIVKQSAGSWSPELERWVSADQMNAEDEYDDDQEDSNQEDSSREAGSSAG